MRGSAFLDFSGLRFRRMSSASRTSVGGATLEGSWLLPRLQISTSGALPNLIKPVLLEIAQALQLWSLPRYPSSLPYRPRPCPFRTDPQLAALRAVQLLEEGVECLRALTPERIRGANLPAR